jgi:hypothetical protein
MSPEEKLFQRPSGPRDLPTKVLAKGRGNAALVAVLTLMSMSTTGCSVMHNGYTALTRNSSWNDTVVVLRNRSHSAKAWHKRKHNFCNERHSQDFCNGFRAGYEAVCGGSDGCTPAFPPPEYWSWEFQSGEGQARTSAWFSGYPYGVQAAEQEGATHWNQLQLSPTMRSQFESAGMLTQNSGGSRAPSAMGTPVVPQGGPGVPQQAPMLIPESFGAPLELPGLPSQGVVPRIQ